MLVYTNGLVTYGCGEQARHKEDLDATEVELHGITTDLQAAQAEVEAQQVENETLRSYITELTNSKLELWKQVSISRSSVCHILDILCPVGEGRSVFNSVDYISAKLLGRK